MLTENAMAVANDATLTDFIRAARRRLVVLAPAVTKPVGEAVAERWRSLGPEAVSVILDPDPEVYRLGYGDAEGLQILESAALEVGGRLTRQFGLRIGLVISDDLTLIFSPTPQLIEAGPRNPEAPNAVLMGTPPAQVARELGLGPEGKKAQTIGLEPVSTHSVGALRKDLECNPPQSFDVARKVMVFNSYFEFVDFSLSGTHIDRKIVRIPPELLGLTDSEDAKERMRASFKLIAPDDALSGKDLETYKTDITKIFLRNVPNFGTVLPRAKKQQFLERVEKLRAAVEVFRTKVIANLQEAMDRNREQLKGALLPALRQNPPRRWREPGGEPYPRDFIEKLLDEELRRAFGQAEALVGRMEVKLVIKGVTYELLKDKDFLEAVAKALPEMKTFYDERLAAEGTSPKQASLSFH
ncbi:MAG: hypothetical protein HY900_31415 [Deltaproteobacteria bacterium]|nr:hypothetical protein [Deltaproteobacteria bacterium]